MAYNRKNYLKKVRYIVKVYRMYKQPDVSDAKIVREHFPEHGIHIAYSTWMNIKGTPAPKEPPTSQLTLF